jgi:hypothetical protein
METNASRARQTDNPPLVVAMPKRTHSLAVAAMIVLCCLLGTGFYRGWFALSTRQETITHKVDINLTVDPERIKQDTKKAAVLTEEKAADLSKKLKKEASALRQQR